MSLKKNEDGYALITVLLIITVFMIVFLSFIGQASNSIKQNQIVERTSQSTAAAEMGIQYYQVVVQNIFEANQKTDTNNVNSQLSSGQDYKTLTTNNMRDLIYQGLQSAPAQVIVDGHPNVYFSIRNITANVIPNTYKIDIGFTSDGTVNNQTLGKKVTSLSADYTVDLSSVVQSANYTIKYVLPAFNEVSIPANPCTSFGNGCMNVLLTDPSSNQFPSGNNNNKSNGNNGNSNNLSDATVYAKGPLTDSGNANGSYNLKIHADDSITENGNLEGSTTKLTLETPQSATFNGNVAVNSSRILIGNSLTAYQKFDLETGSFTYVGSTADIGGNLIINGNSTMCIQGNLQTSLSQISIGKQDETNKSPSQLIIKGNIIDPITKQIVTTSMNGVQTNVSSQDFEAKCGSMQSQSLTINWGQNISTKIQDVNY